MRSKIYEGFVEHTRLKPASHRLKYSLYFFCIDLAELSEMDKKLPLFGYNRMRPLSIYDADYLDDGKDIIKDKIMHLLGQSGIDAEVQSIFLVTQPRYFVSVFNPVSFYYCFGKNGDLRCVVTEVNNTFGERHVYILKDVRDPEKVYPAVFTTDKAFHVSPFNDVSGSYELSFSEIEDEIDIHVDLIRDGEKVFGAQLWGRARPMTTKEQLSIILRHPLIPRLTMARIYWEAAKLYFLRKLAYIPRPVPLSRMTIKRKPPDIYQRLIMKMIEKLLKQIETGRLDLVLPDGSTKSFGKVDPTSRRARMLVNDYTLFSRVAFDGEVGLGEAYMEGIWDSDDLTEMLKLFIENRDAFKGGNMSLSALSRARNFRMHLERANTLIGSKKNIAEHYDLSNDFYRTFLDETMTYSCGIFRNPDESLEQAQHNKFQAIIDKAQLTRDDHVLEIGCGWGGFAVEAVKTIGCSWTGITISKAQYDYARSRVKHEGIEDRIEILLEDYRTMQGRFDKVVSIEMLEAVGHEHLGEFFACCDGLLKPDGLAVLQVITVPDARYDAHRNEPNWIQKHIFPGGVLPSLTAICSGMSARSGLLVESVENIGIHYAETLKRWRQRLIAARDELTKMGFDRTLQRKWIYYFSFCEAQFGLRVLNNLQIVLTREGNRALINESST
jgi:cyclopropane-fatty-acyl-phospholipid synthase